MHDVIIVGAGPAGLSAALVLGRCRRRALVFDAGNPRNAASRAMHGFITRDGEDPREFLRIAREQLKTYPGVELRRAEVVKAERGVNQFTVTLADGSSHTARILLLATGLVDEVPQLPGIESFYGRSVHHCPYCDGWEHRDQAIVVYGRGESGADLALELLGWSENVTLCTDGAPVTEIPSACSARLLRSKIRVIEERIARLEGSGCQISGVRFHNGDALPCQALFFASGQRQRSELVHQLGCKFVGDKVCVEHEETEACGVPGLYVAGNTSSGLQLVIMAAAEGTQAAFKINQALLDADAERTVADVL